MVRVAIPIDISTMPELAKLAEEVERTQTPRILRRGGRDVAVLSPALRRVKRAAITPVQREAVLASVGGWEGLVDAEQLKRDLDEARGQHDVPIER